MGTGLAIEVHRVHAEACLHQPRLTLYVLSESGWVGEFGDRLATEGLRVQSQLTTAYW